MFLIEIGLKFFNIPCSGNSTPVSTVLFAESCIQVKTLTLHCNNLFCIWFCYDLTSVADPDPTFYSDAVPDPDPTTPIFTDLDP